MYEKNSKPLGYFGAFVLDVAILTICFLIWMMISTIYHSGRQNSVAGLKEPVQTDVSGSFRLSKGNYDCTISYKCSYDIEALVVHTKEYPESDDMADTLSPLDLALAWGKVAEMNEEIDFGWEQSDRHCRVGALQQEDVDKLGGVDAITASFSNNHIIPAEKCVEKQLLSIRRGDRVRLRGYLVNVDGYDRTKNRGACWYSSISRTDVGQGACEVFYVTNVDIIEE